MKDIFCFHFSKKSFRHFENLETKRGLRVLSLFDGIGMTLQILKNLKLKVTKYYASEIDETCKLVAKFNHGKEITHISDVTKITKFWLNQKGPFDLIVASPPCDTLSSANPYKKPIDGNFLNIKL